MPVITGSSHLRAALLSGALLLLALALAPAAHAGPRSSRTAAVSIGDSYISGEAGRWQGNSVNSAPGNDGTDRACAPAGPGCMVDRTRVYERGTEPSGECHRSDVAEIRSARLAVDDRFNISCSGGVTRNVFRASSGGEGQNGEAPQADQLGPIARDRNVKLIVVSIGGNDLGFAGIVSNCFQRYETRQGPCGPSQAAAIAQKVPKATADVEKAIDEIRTVMSDAGYRASDYRLVLQTYPSVIPRASESRFGENDPQRTSTGGCPFYDSDLTWGRDVGAPAIGGVVKTAARDRGTEILELKDAFQGREFCSKSTRTATALDPPSPTSSEWGRFLSPVAFQQGDVQEVFHPNAYGQLAFADCLSKLSTQAPGEFDCTNTPGRDFNAMNVARLRAPATPSAAATTAFAPPLKVSVRRKVGRRPGRVSCVTFSVRAAGKPVRGARVRFARASKRTNRRGLTTICRRLRPKRYKVVVSHPSYRTTPRVIRVSSRYARAS